MAKFILGKKIGMSQMFDEKGKQIPVTLVLAGPCKVLQVKTKEKDGYEAVQLGFVDKKKPGKSEKGKGYRYIKEFKDGKDLKAGDTIDVSSFEEKDKVKISGVSKGKGFQGGVKRWGFSGRNATHGVKHEHRTIGSVGFTGPERVIKGKKMPGRMGQEQITLRNLKVVKADKESNILVLKGAVPGPKGTLLVIRG